MKKAKEIATVLRALGTTCDALAEAIAEEAPEAPELSADPWLRVPARGPIAGYPIAGTTVLLAGRRGEIQLRRAGRYVVVARAALEAWLADRPTRAARSGPRQPRRAPGGEPSRVVSLATRLLDARTRATSGGGAA